MSGLAKSAGRCAAALAVCLALWSPAHARYDGNVNLFVGQKWLDENDWEPVDRQPELGVLLAFGIERAPVHFALDVLATDDSDTVDSPLLGRVDVQAQMLEFGIGVRKVWILGATRPFLGAGGCMVMAELEYQSPSIRASFEDNDYGLWVDGGVMWRIGKRVNLGLDVRYSWAEAKFNRNGLPVDVNVGGLHTGVLVGYGW